MDSQCIDCVQKVLQTLDDAHPQMIENCFVLLKSLCHSGIKIHPEIQGLIHFHYFSLCRGDSDIVVFFRGA